MGIYRKNYPPGVLTEMAVDRGEGVLNSSNVLCTYTGNHTGRSPNAKYIVKDSITTDAIDWDENNMMLESEYEILSDKFEFYRKYKETFSQDVFAVRDENYQMSVRIITEHAKHSLFARNMFIPTDRSDFEPEWEVLHFPTILDRPRVIISFKNKRI